MLYPALWVASASMPPPKPHIVYVLVDDFGWANADWHRSGAAKNETATPHLVSLVRLLPLGQPAITSTALSFGGWQINDGIELDQTYAFKFCAPTRSAIQSGRNPMYASRLHLCRIPWSLPVSSSVGCRPLGAHAALTAAAGTSTSRITSQRPGTRGIRNAIRFPGLAPLRSASRGMRSMLMSHHRLLHLLRYRYAGIPTKMTGIASVLKRAGYATHFAGKWDCGMATVEQYVRCHPSHIVLHIETRVLRRSPPREQAAH